MGSVFGPVRFLLPVCRLSWFLYTFNIHLYMPIFSRIFLSNYWWQKSDIWWQASYRYPISWEAFFDPSDYYFLFAEERGYHTWALAHSSSCFITIVLYFLRLWYFILELFSTRWYFLVFFLNLILHDIHYIIYDCYLFITILCTFCT